MLHTVHPFVNLIKEISVRCSRYKVQQQYTWPKAESSVDCRPEAQVAEHDTVKGLLIRHAMPLAHHVSLARVSHAAALA